jgi:sugar phosphate isomerase/epimerase
MIIGAMNHPRRDVVQEITWMAQRGLEFVDLTLEPPLADCHQVDLDGVMAALGRHRLRAVGHTAFYLPIASPFESIRLAAVNELRQCMKAFARVGAKWMNVHPDRHVPMHDRSFWVRRNLQSLRELLDDSRKLGVGLMVENMPGSFNSVEELGELLEPIPELGLHIDIGHCNLHVTQSTAEPLIKAYGARVRHVHLHDNKGGTADLHLPLGAGTVDFRRALRALKASGYDDTITLEVFAVDLHHLEYSRDVLRQAWDEI